MSDFVPDDHTGLWRREVITAPGYRDETTRVLWLQTRSWYADLRVPIDRPPARGEGFGAYSDGELIALAKIQGFAGQLSAAGGVCFWRRDLDHQPAGPMPDEARCGVQGEVMIEDGIHGDYQEIWRRQDASQTPLAALRLEGAGRDGLLVIGGRHMIEFVARPGAAPIGDSLADLVAADLAAGQRASAEALLGTRIRYATRDENACWITQISSYPWLEGWPMWVGAAFDPREGVLEAITGVDRALWRLIDASEPPAERLFAAIATEGAAP
jgi:hypothetical protein